ncbi:PREDICTED: odorant receptor 46a, isoform A-like [Dinoponera quadriceps]|uniref:Odorant receptor 46a, isoform A-like n=1 Tax=Dinoponera quadriceps TaxID=609295 RepID=A0A6P3XDA7_DINQU|nr:PREDICTED: odorant receptor 46a, isoform A-like [Dinoponera quadriceps]
MTLLLFTFMVPQFMDIVLNVDNPDDFTDTFYVMLAMVMAFCKMLGLLLNRQNIKMFTDTLLEKPFRPLEPDEIEIRQKFNNLIQKKAMVYTFMIESTCASMGVTSLLTEFRNGNLAYREWLPYNYSSNIYLFCVTYFHQLISLTAASIVNVACDNMVCGLLLYICCQIEILECRLKKSLRRQSDVGECVQLHNRIYRLAHDINEKFRFIIAVQFIVSTLVVCSNLYRLARAELSPKYIPLALYTICMLIQILIYCWYGNEVKLKSVQLSNQIFAMDWLALDKKRKENLIMIMNRSLIPIEFTSAHILTMNLESFGKLLKVSYSIYNILQIM